MKIKQTPFPVIKIIKQIHYNKLGYIYRKELVVYNGKDTCDFISCYDDKKGYYIGTNKDARKLTKTLGITSFELGSYKKGKVLLGFNKTSQKWYSWNHLAHCSFGVGTKIDKNHIAYKGKDQIAQNLDEAKQMAINYIVNLCR